MQVVNTAGLSPNMAPVERVLAVDLYGTAEVLVEFRRVIAPRGAGLVVFSMGVHMAAPMSAEVEKALALTNPLPGQGTGCHHRRDGDKFQRAVHALGNILHPWAKLVWHQVRVERQHRRQFIIGGQRIGPIGARLGKMRLYFQVSKHGAPPSVHH